MKNLKTLLVVTLVCLSTGASAAGSKKGDPVAKTSSLYSYFMSFFSSEPTPEAPSSSEE